MGVYLFAYVTTALIFLGLDFVWISQMQPILYAPDLGALLAAKPALAPAAAFYVIYFLGVIYFCVAPALKIDHWRKAALNGALFGFCAYATYDLTNQATLRIWSLRVTVADLGWGVGVTAAAATMGFLLTRLMIRATGGASKTGTRP
jgi:uncharacterized membrane protein